jgi:hypothetical protein
MRSSVTAIVFCIFAATAAAQCVTQAPVARVARPGPELIKTASAGMPAGRDLSAQDEVPVIGETAAAKDDGKHHRRAGSAMLLAALALMSGIALRHVARTK